ncbi:2-C-methyl-D-erythritol 4-phosphate cytidylyltransferase [Leptospira langatensis]|uniref:2-C-methyl-D-erythritol 4-phosphate cytidylyltransferase n=1 Tax=Leptospira langatensis TaxID=2484983 RepID=A0A5F1ZT02_9LEPT|nr:IspD/TarI family cytidylyltransferase [Leptospira langatensis]TGK02581.1 2-C-methyl-D-erythritol 4-phosphate cytidylyltransferase [Leptospira langatensis]TGL40219.1 2-C-methyl-D-erythritol 4-phosphate cytidylyltransferase [Leptospira langatensis]
MKSWLPSGNVHVLLLSGGTGSRMGSSLPKQFLELQGKPLLLYSLESLLEWGKTKSIILVSHRDYIEKTEKICAPFLRDWDRIVEGGETRHASTLAGLSCLQIANEDIILVHDAARPFVLGDDLDRLAHAAETEGVATLATRNYETVLEEQKDSFHFLDREKIWFMKTPQAIRGDILKKLPKEIQGFEPTDLCTWTEFRGIPSKLVESHPYNLKITQPEDLALAEAILPLFRALVKN